MVMFFRPAPTEAPRQPEVVEPGPRPQTDDTSGLGQLASVLERMMNAQAEQQGKMLEKILALTIDKPDADTAEKNNEKHYTRGVEKLRLEGIPRWPSLDRHTNMPYYIFAEDLKVWLSLMNHKYGEVVVRLCGCPAGHLAPWPSDPWGGGSPSLDRDATALRVCELNR